MKKFKLTWTSRSNPTWTGLTPEDSYRAARRTIGNLTLLRERARERDPLAWFDATRQDIRYALRNLVRAPLFTAVAILSLGLGIGANTAIFTVINAAMLRSLPVKHAEELVMLRQIDNRSKEWGAFSNALWQQLLDSRAKVCSSSASTPVQQEYPRASD